MVVAVEGCLCPDVVVNVYIAKVYIPGLDDPSAALESIVIVEIIFSGAGS
jgi:hypothetical protein